MHVTLEPDLPATTRALRRLSRRGLAVACFAWVLVSWPQLASAQTDDRARTLAVDTNESRASSSAQALFDAGREAMARGRYELACQKFDESLAAEPAVGTLLNLAHCEERRGLLVSALRRYREALAQLEETDPRRPFTRRQAGALAVRVPQLTLTPQRGAPPDIRLTCNGVRLSHELGKPMSFDPGRVVVVAEAKGFNPRVYQLDLAPFDRERLSVGVGAPIASAQPVVVRAPPPPSRDPSWGYVFLATGGASATAAATFGVLTYAEYRTVGEHCDLERNVCFDAVGQRAARTGAAYETLAYVFGGLGLGSLSVGSLLLLSDGEPKGGEARLSLSLFSDGHALPKLELKGRF